MVGEKRICPNCGDPVTGRMDKVFCGDQCRTDHNNRLKREQGKNAPAQSSQAGPVTELPTGITDPVERVIGILLKNREILAEICDNEWGKGHIRTRDLLGRYFNPKYYTSQSDPTKLEGNIYRFCFEYGYRDEGNGMTVVICRERELD